MILNIYHGSDHIIEKPVYGAGKKYNDYGLGFYCTESPEMAKEWGASENADGYANHYTINCDGLTILDLNSSKYTILHWLSVLLENRYFDILSPLANQAREYVLSAFYVDYKKYDCITGYRADDSYFSFAQDFLNGSISLRQLGAAMHLGKLGQQFVIKSPDAFERLHFEGYEIADHSEWYAKRKMRDLKARKEYLNKERFNIRPGDIFVTQLITEEIKPDDSRLR